MAILVKVKTDLKTQTEAFQITVKYQDEFPVDSLKDPKHFMNSRFKVLIRARSISFLSVLLRAIPELV